MEFIDKVNKKIDDCIKICNEIIQICDFSKDYGLIEKYNEIIEQLETMDLNEVDITCGKENLIDILDKNFEEYKKEKENLINRNKPEKKFIDFNQITINTNYLGFGEITLNGKKLSYVTGFSVQQRINEKSIVTLEFYSDVNLKIEKNNK